MKVALMQPYLFPYIGYLELLGLVDHFIFYDDAAFSKNSWFNRNRIASRNKEFEYIRVAVEAAPLGTEINKIKLKDKAGDLRVTLANLEVYKRAPFYSSIRGLIVDTFYNSNDELNSLAMESIKQCGDYLGFSPRFSVSSALDYDRTVSGLQKVLDICRVVGATEYVNLSGGRTLYDEEVFRSKCLRLSFTEPTDLVFETSTPSFVPNLSIIDPMMSCSKAQLQSYFQSRRRGL